MILDRKLYGVSRHLSYYENAKNLIPESFIIPTGTAIQNGRVAIGDDLTRDGKHLELSIGRYIAACTWFEALSTINVLNNPYSPPNITHQQALIAKKSAHLAIKYPTETSEIN